MQILEQYVNSTPSYQNALDIFEGEWASKLPGTSSYMNAGQIPLFEDVRISWAAEHLGGFRDKKILELGPLEGGHTYMLEHLGACSITAIEANTRAYLKCLIVKEILELAHTKFLLGDVIEYLKLQTSGFDASGFDASGFDASGFDVCIASGILYHMKNPAELIELISKVSNQIFIWTHYYDEELLQQLPNFERRFSSSNSVEHKGFSHRLFRQDYGEALGFAGFCGGSLPFSHWMSRADILACLRFFGFKQIEIGFEDLHHLNGPCFCVAATRV
jgi:hypothetical protein